MPRRILALLLAATISLVGATGATAQTVDSAASDEWVELAAQGVIEEIAILTRLGAFMPEETLLFIEAWMSFDTGDRRETFDELLFIDDLNKQLLLILGQETQASLSAPTDFAMSYLSEDTIERLDRGETGFVDPKPWLNGLIDLLARNGAAPPQRRPNDIDIILDVLIGIETGELDGFSDRPGPGAGPKFAPVEQPDDFGAVDGDQIDAEPTPVTTTAAPVEPATTVPAVELDADEGGDGDVEPAPIADPEGTDTEAQPGGSNTGLLLIGGAAAIAAVLVIAATRKRSGGSVAPEPSHLRPDAGLTDVLEISRQMTAALDEAEIRRIAVTESIRLANAEAGAFVVPNPSGASVTAASTPALFVEGPVRGGALSRVLETGQATQMVSDDDPALERVPVALAAVPVIAAGGVAGAIVVIRRADAPFTSDDVAALELLAPVTGTALRAAATHNSAVTAADVDVLTDLNNRRRLDHDLAELTSTSTLCFAMIDVDHFKNFNDTHGHLAGDIALQSVARAIEQNVREQDTVYRYGGEEFSVLLRGCGVDEAAEVLERVRCGVASTAVPGSDGTPQYLTVSVGISGSDGRSPDELPGSADEALYAAKDSGRDRVVTAS